MATWKVTRINKPAPQDEAVEEHDKANTDDQHDRVRCATTLRAHTALPPLELNICGYVCTYWQVKGSERKTSCASYVKGKQVVPLRCVHILASERKTNCAVGVSYETEEWTYG